MIADSLARQFLVMHRHFLHISAIEEELGITGKSLYKWMVGKRPLPDRWEQPLYDYLYPMLDPLNEIHQQYFQTDKVVVLEEHHILADYQHLKWQLLRKIHFPAEYTSGADVVYIKFVNRNLQESFLSIYSAYSK